MDGKLLRGDIKDVWGFLPNRLYRILGRQARDLDTKPGGERDEALIRYQGRGILAELIWQDSSYNVTRQADNRA